MSAETNTTNESIVDLIARRQVELGKSDEQIAHELGLDRVAAFNLIKQGVVKFPFQKVAVLASALSVEPGGLLRQLLAEAMPDVLEAIDGLLIPSSLTANEIKLVQMFRQLCKGHDVCPVVVDGSAVVALMVA